MTIQNVREWTTHVLRCYYQKAFFGKTKFEIEIQDDLTTNSYIPNYVLKVSEALEAKGVQITLTGL